MTAAATVPPLTASRFPGPLTALLVALPAVIYVRALTQHVINVPVSDDYLAILDFLLRWQDAGAADRPAMLFEQFYSHRIPFTHLLTAGLTGLFGHCDLRVLQVVSWIGWLLLLPSLAWSRPGPARLGWLALLPLSLLLMQPQGHTNLLIATGSPGHAWCLLSAFWSLHLAGRNTPAATTCALLLALIAALCTANGLLLFPVAALARLHARQWRPALLWLAGGTLVWLWYLADYSVAAQPFADHAFSLPGLALNAVTMIGGVAVFGRLDSGIAVLVGTLVIVLALAIGWHERRTARLDANSYFILFLLLSVALTAWARIGWSHDYMLQDRYRLYGVLLLAMLYLKALRLLPPTRQRWFTAGLIPLTAVFCLLSYGQTASDLNFNRRWAEATAMNLQLGRAVPLAAAPEQAARAGSILEQVVARGLLHLPRFLDEPALHQLTDGLDEPAPSQSATLQGIKSAAVGGCLVAPPANLAPGAAHPPSFGILYQGGRSLILPVVVLRTRLADQLTPLRPVIARYQFIVPDKQYTQKQGVLHAIRRTAGGDITVLWSAHVTLPGFATP